MSNLEDFNPNARSLILSMLNARGYKSISISNLRLSGKLFEIDDNAMRVAVARLVKSGYLVTEARGKYTIGARGVAIKNAIQQWVTLGDRTKPWTGEWLTAYVAHLGRTDKKQLRLRERALRLKGFTAAYNGLWVRPDNLKQTVKEIRQELIDMGCDRNILLMQSQNIENDHSVLFSNLWPVNDIENNQKKLINEMASSIKRLEKLPLDAAAKEAFLVGESVIRAINLDPLLPKEIIDTKLRQKLIQKMLNYDKIGKVYWAMFFEDH